MKLSIITPIYKGVAPTKRILRKMTEQTSNSFELILVIDTNTNGILEIVDGYKKELGKKLKIVFNSKRIGRDNAINAAIKVASGTHTMLLEGTDKFSKTLVEDIKEDVTKLKADIIEFKAKFRDPVKFKGKLRLSVAKTVEIKDKPEILAYSYFFTFNKIFKTSVLKKVAEMPLNFPLNSRFSVELVYKALVVAKTYATVNSSYISSNSGVSENFNPLKSMRQFKSTLNWMITEYPEYEAEIKYAMFIQTSVLLFAFAGESKNKVLLGKLKTAYKKELDSTFEGMIETNKYAHSKNREAQLFLKHYTPNNSLTKLYKHFD